MRIVLFSLLVGLAATTACKSEPAEFDGYGQFHIGKSTLVDGYVCSPRGELSYCSNNPSPGLAGHTTTTDLYFRGTEKSSPLVEIIVAVNACKPEAVEAALRKKLGVPDTVRDELRVWTQKVAVVVARLPVEPGVCEIDILAPTETERIAELTGATPSAATP